MKHQQQMIDHSYEVLTFLRSRFSVYHLSNIFFRDIQYGIQEYFGRQGTRVTYAQAENLARAFVDKLEKDKILVPLDRQTWVVQYADFRKPAVKPATSAKSAGPAPAVPGTPAAPKPVAQAEVGTKG